MAKARQHRVGVARAGLLRAAGALFAQRGFEGASTHAIAARARVPQGLVRHHFGSKEALWREVVTARLGDLTAALDRVAAARNAARDPLAIWNAALLEQHELVQLLLHALFEPGPRRGWLIAELSASTPARALLAWAGGDQSAPLTDDDALLISMRVASVCSAPALRVVLATLRGHAIDAAAVTRAQRVAFDRGLRVATRGAIAGPWSLAAAAQRRVRATNAPAAT